MIEDCIFMEFYLLILILETWDTGRKIIHISKLNWISIAKDKQDIEMIKFCKSSHSSIKYGGN